MPLACPSGGCVEHTKLVSPICLLNVDRNRYNLPALFTNRPVGVRVYSARIVITAEGQILFELARVIDPITGQGGRSMKGGMIW